MSRRSREWVSSYIVDPDKLRREGDPAALALAEKFKTIRMPRLGLAEGDVQDLIAYVEAQTFNVSASKPAAGHHNH